MATAVFVNNGFVSGGRLFKVTKPQGNIDFWDGFMDWAELEFGFGHEELEEGIRFGFSFLGEEELWQRPLFNLALQVGESFGLAKEQVKQELQQLLHIWNSVRHHESCRC